MNYTYINFPDILVQGLTWGLQGLSTTFTSPNGAQQSIARTALWVATIKFDILEEADTRMLQAFMARLTDPAIVFYMKYPAYKPLGSVAGTPKVAGGSQAGSKTLATSGWTASAAGVLKAGDLITLATKQMLRVTSDVNADASGNATVNVSPYIRSAPANLSAIECNNPTCVMQLPKFSSSFSVSPPMTGALTIEAQEVIL